MPARARISPWPAAPLLVVVVHSCPAGSDDPLAVYASYHGIAFVGHAEVVAQQVYSPANGDGGVPFRPWLAAAAAAVFNSLAYITVYACSINSGRGIRRPNFFSNKMPFWASKSSMQGRTFQHSAAGVPTLSLRTRAATA